MDPIPNGRPFPPSDPGRRLVRGCTLSGTRHGELDLQWRLGGPAAGRSVSVRAFGSFTADGGSEFLEFRVRRGRW